MSVMYEYRVWMSDYECFWVKHSPWVLYIHTHTEHLCWVNMVYHITGLNWIFISSQQSASSSKVGVTDHYRLEWYSLPLLLIPNCCNLMGAGQGRCPKLLLDLLAILCPLVKYTSIPSPWIDTVLHIMYTNLQTSGGRSEGEISNSFALALVAALHSTWLITVGNI